jgi:hypothetical protein
MDTSNLGARIYDYLTAKLRPIEKVLDDEKQVEMDGIVSGAAQEIAQMNVEATEAILKINQGGGGGR